MHYVPFYSLASLGSFASISKLAAFNCSGVIITSSWKGIWGYSRWCWTSKRLRIATTCPKSVFADQTLELLQRKMRFTRRQPAVSRWNRLDSGSQEFVLVPGSTKIQLHLTWKHYCFWPICGLSGPDSSEVYRRSPDVNPGAMIGGILTFIHKGGSTWGQKWLHIFSTPGVIGVAGCNDCIHISPLWCISNTLW